MIYYIIIIAVVNKPYYNTLLYERPSRIMETKKKIYNNIMRDVLTLTCVVWAVVVVVAGKGCIE